MHVRRGQAIRVLLGGSFAGLVISVFFSTLRRGLWEDGYFVQRFATQFWRHGTFAWNPSDGPVYGMTSQTLQLIGTLLYAIDPRHLVTSLRATLCGALLASLFVIERSARRHTDSPLTIVPAVIGLSLPLVLELATTGLETVVAIAVVGLAIGRVLELDSGTAQPGAAAIAGVLVYWTRPDAVLIVIVLLAALSGSAFLSADQLSGARAAWSSEPVRRGLRAVWLLAGGLALSLVAFRLYYGTALPLPFYIKTQGISVQSASHLAVFANEKTKNALQAVVFGLPFVFVALHERTRVNLSLLASGFALAAYHYVATIETMGHLSRFYVPALVPVWLAAMRAYPVFLQRRRLAWVFVGIAFYVAMFAWLARLDARHRIDLVLDPSWFYPYVAACGVMLAWPVERAWIGAAAIAVSLCAAAAIAYPPRRPKLEDDLTILLRQIAPRRTFRGLGRLYERVPGAHAIFHTDMGAPGVLFPDARVVDLDGLLSKAITLDGARFETLCQADEPEAIFVPNETYPELRREVLESSCLRGYRAVDDDPTSPLRIREDLREQYLR
jgi:hypothetical protein